eukprot:2556695-Amphidinium_carterae.1
MERTVITLPEWWARAGAHTATYRNLISFLKHWAIGKLRIARIQSTSFFTFWIQVLHHIEQTRMSSNLLTDGLN